MDKNDLPPRVKAEIVDETFARLRKLQLERQRTEFDDLMDSLSITDEPLKRELWRTLQTEEPK